MPPLLYWNFSMANRFSTKRVKPNGKASPRVAAKADASHAVRALYDLRLRRPRPQEEAVALVRGNLKGRVAPLVRVHSQCLTGDVLNSLRCDCRAQLELSLKKIAAGPFRNPALPAAGRPRHRPDEQTARLRIAGWRHGHGGGQRSARLCRRRPRVRIPRENSEETGRHADSPAFQQSGKSPPTGTAGIKVVERVPCQPRLSKISRAYLQTKKQKMGHLLEGV